MFDYLVRILFSGQQATSEAKKVRDSVGSIENAARSAVRYLGGIVGTGALISYAKQTISWASAMGDLAKRTGVSVEKLQEWGYAADLAGASQNDITAALRRLAIAQVEASEAGKGTAFEAFQRFGLALAEIKGLRTEELFERISVAIKGMAPSAQVTTDTVELMGRSADNLLPAFREGFGAAAEEARKLGLIIDKEDIEAIKRLDDTITMMKVRSRAELGTIMGMMSDPSLTKAYLSKGFLGRFIEAQDEQALELLTGPTSMTDIFRLVSLPGWIANIGESARRAIITTGQVERYRQMQESAGLTGPTGALEAPVTRELLEEIRSIRQSTRRMADAVEEKL